jgi:hypothetical protein
MTTGIDYISPTQETGNSLGKFIGVLIGSFSFDHRVGYGGSYVSPIRKGM